MLINNCKEIFYQYKELMNHSKLFHNPTHIIMKIANFRLQSQSAKRYQVIVSANDVILENGFAQLKVKCVTRLNGNDSKCRQEQLNSQIERKNGISYLVVDLFGGRLNPNLWCDFVDFEVEREEDEVTAD